VADAVDPEVDALFDLPADAFVAARDALAKARRAAGDRPAAAAIKQLRRPTLSAWALNQLARRHGDDVRTLVDQGAALAAAQEQALAGADVDLRAAGRARTETLRRLARAAEAELAGQGSPAHRDEVVATLTAASVDPASADLLLDGRLSEPLETPAGFGGPFAASSVPEPPSPAGTSKRGRSSRTTSDDVAARAESTSDPGEPAVAVGEVPAADRAASAASEQAAPLDAEPAAGPAVRRRGRAAARPPSPHPEGRAATVAPKKQRKGEQALAAAEASAPVDAVEEEVGAHAEIERAPLATAGAGADVSEDVRAQEEGGAGASDDARSIADADAEAAAAAQAAAEAAAAADEAADRVVALEDELARAREVLAEAEQEAGRRRRAAAAAARAAGAAQAGGGGSGGT
jgi:hypothetical protein